MDNRKFSARADVGGMTPAIRSTGSSTAFLDRAIDLTKANWEVIFFVGLMIVAVLTRLMDLGPRALHHDESIHAYYSNLYSKGAQQSNSYLPCKSRLSTWPISGAERGFLKT